MHYRTHIGGFGNVPLSQFSPRAPLPGFRVPNLIQQLTSHAGNPPRHPFLFLRKGITFLPCSLPGFPALNLVYYSHSALQAQVLLERNIVLNLVRDRIPDGIEHS
jgi:hypothetical protein